MDNILLIIAGLVAASCFFGATFYLISVTTQIKYSKTERVEPSEDPDAIE
jgi:hypothetical protein